MGAAERPLPTFGSHRSLHRSVATSHLDSHSGQLGRQGNDILDQDSLFVCTRSLPLHLHQTRRSVLKIISIVLCHRAFVLNWQILTARLLSRPLTIIPTVMEIHNKVTEASRQDAAKITRLIKNPNKVA
jgi:hypothetical protein